MRLVISVGQMDVQAGDLETLYRHRSERARR